MAKSKKEKIVYSAKECAYIAVFVALTIASQLALSFAPGVEVVTVLFVAYAFSFGVIRGMLAATAFSLLRLVMFSADIKTLVLYLIYYNALTLTFGLLGKKGKRLGKSLPFIVGIACVCTACFTLLDNFLTPLWYGYTQKAAQLYFRYSLPVMLTQTVCTAITVTLLFLPLRKAFSLFV